MIVEAQNWHPFNRANELVRSCYEEQIRPPKLGECRIVIGSLVIGIVLFYFENHGEVPEHYMIVAHP